MAKGNTVPTWKQYNRPWYQKLFLAVWNYIRNVGLMLWSVIKAVPRKVAGFFVAIGLGFQGLWYRFKKGDWRTRLSYLFMGAFGFTRKRQIAKGLLWFAVEALYAVFMIFIGAPNISKLVSTPVGGADTRFTLGEVATKRRPSGLGYIVVDNSLIILIFSVMTILLTVFFVYMYVKNTKIAYETQKTAESGKALDGFKQQLNYALNDGYQVTVLALPIIGILLITVLPLLCNIIVAFTNYDGFHRPPAKLFGWVGFDNFVNVFGKSYGSIIWRILGWTLIWAFFATFTNFFFGMFLAMMINKKSIKMKAFWRTCFIIVIAVPDFVTLLMMSKFFGYNPTKSLTGAFNQILQQWFHLDVNIDWLGGTTLNTTMARTMIIIINMWRGMPYTMLATSGILMNIPSELYESSRIDGAGPLRRFISITFPYIMFVMGPQLITTFTGNINNFNVIFFLTGGEPRVATSTGSIHYTTDLLITWLYRLTINKNEPQFGNGAVIGLFTFIITSFFALIVFNSSKSNKQEDTFQ